MYVIKRKINGRISYFNTSETGWTENINDAYTTFYKQSAQWLVNSLGCGTVEEV